MMVSNNKTDQKNRHASRRGFVASAGDYRVLGLKHSESRADVIRMATEKKVNSICNNMDVASTTDRESKIASISLAAYRLLDPRRRGRLGERVLLCYPLDRDDWEPKTHAPLSILDIPKTNRTRYLWSKARQCLPGQMSLSGQLGMSGQGGLSTQLATFVENEAITNAARCPRIELNEMEQSRQVVRLLRLAQRRESVALQLGLVRQLGIPTLVCLFFVCLALVLTLLRSPF